MKDLKSEIKELKSRIEIVDYQKKKDEFIKKIEGMIESCHFYFNRRDKYNQRLGAALRHSTMLNVRMSRCHRRACELLEQIEKEIENYNKSVPFYYQLITDTVAINK